MNAWIVTWEYFGDKSELIEELVTILSSRKSVRQMALFLEEHYLLATGSASDLKFYANRRGRLPYQALTTQVINSVPHGDRVTCGHNPFLYARKVTALEVKEVEKSREEITWTEPSKFKYRDGQHSDVIVAEKGQKRSIIRSKLKSIGRYPLSFDE